MREFLKNNFGSIIVNVTVMFGVILVVYELNQSHVQARAQLNMNDYTNWLNHELTLMGDNPASALVKAMEDPNSLTPEEKIVIGAHLQTAYLLLETSWKISDIGVYNESWKDSVSQQVADKFNFPYAQQWWSEYKARHASLPQELAELMDLYMESTN